MNIVVPINISNGNSVRISSGTINANRHIAPIGGRYVSVLYIRSIVIVIATILVTVIGIL